MQYSPRQVEAWLFIARRRRSRELADALQMTALGSQGSGRAVNEQAKRLRDE